MGSPSGFLVYSMIVGSVFIAWFALLYIIKNPVLRGFLATIFSIFIFQTIAYIDLGYLDKFVGIAVIVQGGICIILIIIFEFFRDVVFKRNKKR